MLSVDGGEDYLDRIFASRCIPTFSLLSCAEVSNTQRQKSSRTESHTITYADRVRDKVSTISKLRNSREQSINSYLRDKLIAEKLSHFSGRRPLPVLPSSTADFMRTDLNAKNEVNRLQKLSSEFKRYCKLRDAFIRQLLFFFSTYDGLLPSLAVEGECLDGSRDVSHSIEKDLFFSLIIALRRSSVRIVECYLHASKSCESSASQAVSESVLEMRGALTAMVRGTSLNIFPEPFNSWIAITREKNIFFMTKAIDGRRAIYGSFLKEKEKVKPLPSPSPLSRSSSQNTRTYPAELQLSKLETKRIEFLSNVLRKILLNAPVEALCTYTVCPVRYDTKEALTRTHTPTHEDPSLSGAREPSIRCSNLSSAKNVPEIPSENSYFHGYAEHNEHLEHDQQHDQQHQRGEEDEEEQTMYRQESRGRDRTAVHSPPGQGQPSLSYSPSSLSISSSISSPHPSAPSPSFAHPQYTSSMSLESSKSRVHPTNSRQGCTDDDNTLSLSLPPPLHDDTPPLSPAITHLNKSDGSSDDMFYAVKESSHTLELDLIVEELEKQRQLYAKYAEDCLSMFINAEVEKRRKDVEKVKIEKKDGNEMEKEEGKEDEEGDKDQKEREHILPKELVEMLRAMDNQESKAGQRKQKKEKREKHVRRKSRLQRCLDCQNLVANSIDFSVYSNAHTADEK